MSVRKTRQVHSVYQQPPGGTLVHAEQQHLGENMFTAGLGGHPETEAMAEM